VARPSLYREQRIALAPRGQDEFRDVTPAKSIGLPDDRRSNLDQHVIVTNAVFQSALVQQARGVARSPVTSPPADKKKSGVVFMSCPQNTGRSGENVPTSLARSSAGRVLVAAARGGADPSSDVRIARCRPAVRPGGRKVPDTIWCFPRSRRVMGNIIPRRREKERVRAPREVTGGLTGETPVPPGRAGADADAAGGAPARRAARTTRLRSWLVRTAGTEPRHAPPRCRLGSDLGVL